MKKGGRSTVKELLLELAEAVQHAVAELVEDPAEVVGRGADGAPSTRIDRVAEAAVLRVLEYEEARLNVLSEEAGFIDRGGDATLVLDPIDGTHNARRGVPAHSVSMAARRAHLADIAAGTLIVREAGGFVLDLGGRDLDLPLEAKARTDLVAVGDRRAWEAIQ